MSPQPGPPSRDPTLSRSATEKLARPVEQDAGIPFRPDVFLCLENGNANFARARPRKLVGEIGDERIGWGFPGRAGFQ